MTVGTRRSAAAGDNSEPEPVATKRKGGSSSKAPAKRPKVATPSSQENSASSSKDTLDFTPEMVSAFLKFQQSQATQAKASTAAKKKAEKIQKAQESLAIQACNKELLDQEVSEDEGTDATPSRKGKASAAIVLSEDEMALAQQLNNGQINLGSNAGLPDFVNDADGDDEGQEEDNTEQDQGQKNDVNTDEEDGDEANADDGQEAGREETGGGNASSNPTRTFFDDNGLNNMDASSKALPKKGAIRSKLKERFSASPAPSATSISQASTTSESQKSTSSKASKVVRDQFSSPDILQLADTSKSYLRTQICFGNWTLDSDTTKPDWIWSIITATPAVLGETAHAMALKALKLIEKDENQKSKLIIYVGYGKTVLFNTIITKARQRVAGYFGLQSGSSQEIQTKVEWLLTASSFIYGDLDMKAKTYNETKPFGNPFIKDLIQAIWFNTVKNGSKVEAMTTRQMMEKKEVPLTIVFLVVTAIEHSIGEYCSGTCSQAHFRENQIRTQFIYQTKTWNGLTKKSKNWTDAYPGALFSIILKTCGDLSYLLEGEDEINEDDIKAVDGAHLDNIAANGMEIF